MAGILDSQPWNDLVPWLARCGADAPRVLPRLRRYAELLLEWNHGFSNLISSNDERRFVARHLLESLQAAHWLAACRASRWMDLGSGGGLPAVPLALAGIGETWTLVESRHNKVMFLSKTVRDLELDNFRVEEGRLERLDSEMERLGGFDAFTSRATMKLGPTLALASKWVGPGGTAFLWKGSRVEQEMAEQTAWGDSWELEGLLGVGSGPAVVARFNRKG